METRKIDNFTEARLKPITGHYAYVVVTYDNQRRGEYEQRYYTAEERDKAYADFMNR